MRIDGSIPIHIAKAYGLRPAAKSTEPSPAPQPSIVGRVAPSATTVPTPKISKLIAGKVDQPIDPYRTAFPAAPSPQGVLQLYARAADRIEAAVAVEIGRQLDVKG